MIVVARVRNVWMEGGTIICHAHCLLDAGTWAGDVTVALAGLDLATDTSLTTALKTALAASVITAVSDTARRTITVLASEVRLL